MSTVVNEGVKIRFNTFINQVFTVLLLCVELIAAIKKPKGFIEVYLSVSQPSIIVNSESPVICSSLFSSLLFISEFQSHL